MFSIWTGKQGASAGAYQIADAYCKIKKRGLKNAIIGHNIFCYFIFINKPAAQAAGADPLR